MHIDRFLQMLENARPGLSEVVVVVALLCATMQPIVAQAAIHIEGSLSHEKSARPGDSYAGTIAIRNSGDTAVDIKLYRTDYAFAADGSNDYGAPGRLPRSNAHWLQLAEEQISIPARGVVNARYAVKVPADAALQGSYWSMVMVEGVPAREAAPPPTARKGEIRTAVNQVLRYGIQVVTEVGSGGKRELLFDQPKLLSKDGRRLFFIDVANSGERKMSAQLSLELQELQSGARHKFEGDRKRIYPATAVRYQLDLSTLAPGRYRALAAADAGGDDLFGSQFELTVR